MKKTIHIHIHIHNNTFEVPLEFKFEIQNGSRHTEVDRERVIDMICRMRPDHLKVQHWNLLYIENKLTKGLIRIDKRA